MKKQNKIILESETDNSKFWDDILGLSEKPITKFVEPKEENNDSNTMVWSLFVIKFSLEQGFNLNGLLKDADFLGTCLKQNEIHYVWNLKNKEIDKELINSLQDFKECSIIESGLIELLFKDIEFDVRFPISSKYESMSEKEIKSIILLSQNLLLRIAKSYTIINDKIIFENY